MWVAKNLDGIVCMFYTKPYRKSVFWTIEAPDEVKKYTKGLKHYEAINGYWMVVDAKEFPDLKWEDEPMEVDIVVKAKPSEQKDLSVDDFPGLREIKKELLKKGYKKVK